MRLHRRQFLGTAAFGVIATPFAGCALLLDVHRRRIIYLQGEKQASEWLAPPGSTLKPFSLAALLSSGKLRADEFFACPGRLYLDGLNMTCSHPRLPFPVNAARAIAYSCNCAIAHFAQRFVRDELPQFLTRCGLASSSRLSTRMSAAGSVQSGLTDEALELQALGERGVQVTALSLTGAYLDLAKFTATPQLTPVLDGLESAVEVGTGQRARVPGVVVAGKTGTVRLASGLHAAWFAGFAPSRHPDVVVTVLTQGRSGAGSAAPVAGDLLRRYFSGARL